MLRETSLRSSSFQKLQERLIKLEKNREIDRLSDGLIYLFLSHRFYVDRLDILESLTDGGNDCGIDAVYIEHRGDQPVIHLMQSKVHESERKAKNPFKFSAVERVKRFLEILSDKDAKLDKLLNSRLIEKVYEIRELQRRDFPEYKIWLLSNGAPCVDHEIEPTIRALRKIDVSIEEFHADEFVEFCINAHSTRTQHKFSARDAGVLELGNSELRSFVGFISAEQLYLLLKDLRDEKKIDYSLFDMNVRGFLGLNNPVNKDIFRTAASHDNLHFSSFNNGISIVGTQCKVNRIGTDNPTVLVKRLSIVNGAQTCSAIFDAMKDYYPDFVNFDKLSILFRIFETDSSNLIARISISTNNQNRISQRDLRANDKEQIRLEKELAKRGIKYLRKRGYVADNTEEDRTLDALRAGQLILSYTHLDPARAKRDSDEIFDDHYHRIFANAKVDDLVEAMEWYELIEEKRRYIQDEIRIRGIARTEHNFVTYGSFHILMLCSILGRNTHKSNRILVIDKAISIIAEELRLTGEPAYYTYFRDRRLTDTLRESANQLSLPL